jgi:hypothetical protein
MRHRTALLWIVTMAAMGILRPAGGEDFRIETKVYVGNSKTPMSENTTLFRAGYVYDYLTSGAPRVTVFDQRGGRFILLDPVRKIKAELKLEDIRLQMDERRQLAKRSLNPTLRFAGEPEFETKFTEAGELILESQHMTYSLRTMPAPSNNAAQQYREFSDWYARFNTIANPGSLPQFPRLVVNKELAERSVVPTEVILKTRTDSASSEHNVSWRLLEIDQQRIAQTESQLAAFKDVKFEELLAPPAANLSKR